MVLGRGQVTILRNTRGGDEVRVSVLSNELGLPLVGRPQLDARVLPLLTAILEAKALSSWLQPNSAAESVKANGAGPGAVGVVSAESPYVNSGMPEASFHIGPVAASQSGNSLTAASQNGGPAPANHAGRVLPSSQGVSLPAHHHTQQHVSGLGRTLYL